MGSAGQRAAPLPAADAAVSVGAAPGLVGGVVPQLVAAHLQQPRPSGARPDDAAAPAPGGTSPGTSVRICPPAFSRPPSHRRTAPPAAGSSIHPPRGPLPQHHLPGYPAPAVHRPHRQSGYGTRRFGARCGAHHTACRRACRCRRRRTSQPSRSCKKHCPFSSGISSRAGDTAPFPAQARCPPPASSTPSSVSSTAFLMHTGAFHRQRRPCRPSRYTRFSPPSLSSGWSIHTYAPLPHRVPRGWKRPSRTPKTDPSSVLLFV